MSALARIEARDRQAELEDRGLLCQRILSELGLQHSATIPLADLNHVIEQAFTAGRAIELAFQQGDHCCRVCGCTQDRACEDGCWWVDDDLCSSCEMGG